MRQLIAVSLVALAIGVLRPGTAAAQTWMCKQADGTEVFTNAQEPGCVRYEPKSELGHAAGGAMGQPAREDYPVQSQSTPESALADLDQPGQISYEQFRRLDRGMTEGQVLSKLGQPMNKTTLPCTKERSQGPAGSATTMACSQLWSYTMADSWVADLTFIGGRLSEFEKTRLPESAAPVQAQQDAQISFEQFRMLTRGMTEGQVISKLGQPINRTTLSCTGERSQGPAGSTTTVVCPVLWTYTMPEGWTADLTFLAGRLEEFNNSKP